MFHSICGESVDVIAQNYADYYGDPSLAKWRQLCARDKAANVIALWSLVGKSSSPSLVDIGCGDGAVIWELGQRGFGQAYTGLEVSESGVAYAQRRQYPVPVNFNLFDGTHVPVADKSFDLAILSHVLEHVEAPRLLLKEAARVAKYVFIEVPLELNARTPHDFSWTHVGHTNLYNPLLLRCLVQSTGLRVLAEKVTCPSRAVFIFQRPTLPGILHWAAKTIFLKVVPTLAYRVLTYHGCLIAK